MNKSISYPWKSSGIKLWTHIRWINKKQNLYLGAWEVRCSRWIQKLRDLEFFVSKAKLETMSTCVCVWMGGGQE